MLSPDSLEIYFEIDLFSKVVCMREIFYGYCYQLNIIMLICRNELFILKNGIISGFLKRDSFVFDGKFPKKKDFFPILEIQIFPIINLNPK